MADPLNILRTMHGKAMFRLYYMEKSLFIMSSYRTNAIWTEAKQALRAGKSKVTDQH